MAAVKCACRKLLEAGPKKPTRCILAGDPSLAGPMSRPKVERDSFLRAVLSHILGGPGQSRHTIGSQIGAVDTYIQATS